MRASGNLVAGIQDADEAIAVGGVGDGVVDGEAAAGVGAAVTGETATVIPRELDRAEASGATAAPLLIVVSTFTAVVGAAVTVRDAPLSRATSAVSTTAACPTAVDAAAASSALSSVIVAAKSCASLLPARRRVLCNVKVTALSGTDAVDATAVRTLA